MRQRRGYRSCRSRRATTQIAAPREGGGKIMLRNKLKSVGGCLVVVGFLAGALGVLTPSGQPQVRGQEPQRPSAKEAEKPQATVTWKERHTIKAERGTQIF